MVDFSKKELSELEALQIYGGSVNDTTNDSCGGDNGKHDFCVNIDCSHGSCTHVDCKNQRCTHDHCISKQPIITPGDTIKYINCPNASCG